MKFFMMNAMANRDRREALRGAEEETFDLLAEVLKLDEWTELLKAPLERAVANGNRSLAQKLVRAGADIGEALHAAAQGGHGEIVNDLLENGASAAAKDAKDASIDGYTPLHVAARAGKTEMVQLLLLQGTDKEILSSRGLTPLHVAAMKDKAEAIDVLVEAGANVEARDTQSRTPLHLAAGEANLDPVLALLKHGADVKAQDRWQTTPLHYAVAMAGEQLTAEEQGAAEVVDSLLRSGADETILNGEGQAAAEYMEQFVKEQEEEGNQLIEDDVERVRELLANAPADRAWRRRGYLVLCRAHPNRVRQMQDVSSAYASMAETTPSGANLERAEASGCSGCVEANQMDGLAAVVAMVLGLQEGIFRTIVGYL